MEFSSDLSFAQDLDKNSSVNFRDRFMIPTHNGAPAIYFLGNSLGLQPKTTAAYTHKVLDTWSALGVEGFFRGDDPWLDYHNNLAEMMAPVVGARPDEVVIMNALTVNLHLMLVSFYQPQGRRNKIICEAKAFPSDQYMLETHLRQRGLNPDDVLVEVAPKTSAFTIDEEDIIAAIEEHKDSVALVFWGGVNYYTGQVFNMQAIAGAAHKAGAKVGFDLAHAAGNVPLQLHGWDVDFACWCNYKYLNSGPGAVAGTYVHQRFHNDATLQRYAGWWGYKKETRFQMQKGFVPIASAEGWGLSTPSPILFAAHKAALEIFKEAGMENLAARGKWMSSYLLYLLNEVNAKAAKPMIQVITPQKEEERGCQVSMLMLQNGKEIFEYLSLNGVFADWREPDVIRVAPAPLYNTFEELWQFGKIISDACKKQTSS